MNNFKRIKIEGFQGIKEMEADLNQINVLVGPIGVGKTSFVEAVRVALKGKTPRRSTVNNSSKKAIITLTDDGGNVISRTFKEGTNALEQKIRYNGTVVTAKALKEIFTEQDDISVDILTNPNSFIEMDKKAKSEFILNHMCYGVVLSLDKLKSLSGLSDKAINLLSQHIKDKENISVKELSELYSHFYTQKSELSKKVAVLLNKSIYDGMLPKKTISQLQEELNEVSKREATFIQYKKNLAQSLEKEGKIKALESELSTMKVISSSTEELNLLLSLLRDNLKTISKSNGELEGVYRQNQKSIETLKGNTCPLNKSIICLSSERKSMELELNEKNLQLEKQIEENKKEVVKIEKEIAGYEENVRLSNLYNNKLVVIKTMKDSLVKLDVVREENFEEQKRIINEELLSITNYQNSLKFKKEYEEEKSRLDVVEEIVDALKAKSKTMDAIGNYIIKKPLEIINETARELNLDFVVDFSFSDGVEICMVTKEKGSVDFESLSGGEKKIVSFLLFDYIDQLYGNGLLVIDDLDRLDAKTFRSLISLIEGRFFADSYRMVILCMVHHSDLLDELKDSTVNIIEM